MDIKKLNEELKRLLEEVYYVIAYKNDEAVKAIESTKENYKKDVKKLSKLNPDIINVFVEKNGQLSHITEY